MSAGTKIFLAVVAVLMAILVLYYGVLMPAPDSDIVMDPDAADTSAESDEDDAASPASEDVPPDAPVRDPEPDRTPTPSPRSTDSEVTPPDEPEDERPGLDVNQPVSPAIADTTNPTPLETLPPTALPTDPDRGGGKDGPIPTTTTVEDDDEPEVGAAEADEDVSRDDETAPAAARDANPPTANQPARIPPRERPQSPPAHDETTSESPRYTTYTVREGDTMSSIAGDWFGDPRKWDLIAKANPYVDPNRLTIGQELRLPPKDSEREEITGRAGSHPTIYTVRSGDNLSKIARAYYGDGGLWRIIFEANRPTIGLSPDNLKVGMRLTIPPAPQPAEDDER